MTSKEIIALLPYQSPFLFVDEIISVDKNTLTGTYTFDRDLPFYDGHFKNNPVTPGVILIETMTQIGLVSFGIHLMEAMSKSLENIKIAFTSAEVDFYIPVLPGEKVTVKSEKIYFRFNKLKCKVEMYNELEELVCRGTLAGMIRL